MARRTGNTRQKILDSAYELFYDQGYQATTVDQVIQHSGISKPTVYSYFPTKEDLCVEYLKERHLREIALLKEAVRKKKSPKGRFTAIIEDVRERILESDYRGCGFFNMVTEIADPDSPIVRVARSHTDAVREVISNVISELKESDAKYSDVDIEELTDCYYLIICGAIMASQEYRERWPVDRAVEQVKALLRD